MDPATLIVTALVSGVAAGLKPTAEQAVKDAYLGLKNLIQSRYLQVDVKPLEQKPDSQPKQDSVAEDLKEVGADKDIEVLHAAQELVKLIESREPAVAAAAAAGITLERLKAVGSINIKDLIAAGAVQINDLHADVDITIQNLSAGQEHPNLHSQQQQGDDPKA